MTKLKLFIFVCISYVRLFAKKNLEKKEWII